MRIASLKEVLPLRLQYMDFANAVYSCMTEIFLQSFTLILEKTYIEVDDVGLIPLTRMSL